MTGRRLVYGLIVLGAVLISWYGVRGVTVLAMVEHWLEDIRIATLQPPEAQHPDIVLLTITEETLARFPYRSPVDRAFLADVLQRLQRAGVRGILMDLLLDQPTEPDKDELLKTTLEQLTVPIMVSYGSTEALLTEAQLAFQEAFIPKADRGLANLVQDTRDQMVRWVFNGTTGKDGTFLPGVVPGLVSKLGITPPNKQIPIAWRGRPDADTAPFRAFPSHMLPLLPASWFQDKIVIIGVDLPMTDRHRTPFVLKKYATDNPDRFGSSGMVIHAHALAQLLSQRSPPQIAPFWQGVVTVVAALGGVLAVLVNMAMAVRLMIVSFGVLLFIGGGFVLYQQGGVILPLLTPTLSWLLAFVGGESYERQQDRQQKKFLKEAFSKYLSKKFVDHLVSDRDFLKRRAERRELTFLFTDIENFTTMSEKAEPEKLAVLMNHYLDGVCNICLDHGGMVVDLMGDAVFAMFNAPIDLPNHANMAVQSALEVREFAARFQQREDAHALGFGRTRIGIHSGVAQVGNFGSTQQFKYTPLGDAVNIASRIEGLNKFFATDICISDATVQASGWGGVRPLGRFVLKGKGEALMIHEIPPEGFYSNDYLEKFRMAFSLLGPGHAPVDALEPFEELARENPQDKCVAWYLSRLRLGLDCSKVVMMSK
ncbi:MAG: adenylate/guanylate cyclase domain-containing protein [Magnetococcales bacterium]|nr:adenylate/guanylate cyclase domain-containing protein [Magnetococcales bacterium]